jgi:hypothetical protein
VPGSEFVPRTAARPDSAMIEAIAHASAIWPGGHHAGEVRATIVAGSG